MQSTRYTIATLGYSWALARVHMNIRVGYRYRVRYDTDIGIEFDSIPLSESSSIRYRYRNRVRHDTDIGIEFDTIPTSESSSIRYRCLNRVQHDTDIGIEFDTMPISESSSIRCRWTKKNINRYDTDIDTWKLSFSIFIKNTGTPGDGGQNTFDTIYPSFDISIYRNFRYDIQHY